MGNITISHIKLDTGWPMCQALPAHQRKVTCCLKVVCFRSLTGKVNTFITLWKALILSSESKPIHQVRKYLFDFVTPCAG